MHFKLAVLRAQTIDKHTANACKHIQMPSATHPTPLTLSEEVLNPVILARGSALLSCVPRQRASPPFVLFYYLCTGRGWCCGGGAERLRHKQQQQRDFLGRGGVRDGD